MRHANPTQEGPVRLILDGHKIHTNNLPFIEMAHKYHVTVLCLSLLYSQRMQPLDVGFMKLLMTYYTQSVENWLRNYPGRMVTTSQTTGLFRSVYLRAATMLTAVKEFRKAGTWPVVRHVFLDRDFAAAAPTNIELMEDVALNAAGDGEAHQAVQQTDRDTVPHAALAVGVAEAPRDTVLNGTGMDMAQVPRCGSLAQNPVHDMLAAAVANTDVAKILMSTIRNLNSMQLSPL